MQIKLKINFQMRFVIDTINSGIQKYPTDNLIIHSDRGVHYKNNVYQMLLKNNNIQQSMSHLLHREIMLRLNHSLDI